MIEGMIPLWMYMIITIICSVLASSGFWAFMIKQSDKDSASNEMLKGLGHDRILYLGMMYIERGCITSEEYESLNTYLYIPYTKLKGNGSAMRIMDEVKRLPILKSTVIFPRPDRTICEEVHYEK